MNKYALIFRQSTVAESNWSEQRKEESKMEWGSWIQELSNDNAFLQGHRFLNDGMVLNQNKIWEQGPDLTNGLSLIGYFIIQCENIEAAKKYAENCPVISEGGMLEVREIAN